MIEDTYIGVNLLDWRTAISFLHLFAKLTQLLNHDLVVIPLLQPTNNLHRNWALHILHKNRHSTPMNRILLRRLAQPRLRLELLLVPLKLVMQLPCATLPPDHRIALASNPEVVIQCGSRVCDGMEEHVWWGADSGDVDYGRFVEGQETVAKGAAELEGDSRIPVWEC